MKRSRALLVLGLVCVMAFGLAQQVSASLLTATVKFAHLNSLSKAGKWAELEKAAASFVSSYKSKGAAYEKMVLGAFDFQANSQEKQGKYGVAADTVRALHAYKPNPKNIDRVMALQNKDTTQRDYYNKTMAYYRERQAAFNQLYKLAKEKNALINALLQAKGKLTKEALEKLQAQVKELNAQISKQNAAIKEMAAKYLSDTEQYRSAGIIFTPAQNLAVQTQIALISAITTQVAALEKGSATALIALAEKYQMSWDGLEEKLTKLQQLQKQILAAENELLALLNKKTFTDADKKKINDLKAALDKLLAENDKLLSDVEKAFMDSKVFAAMSAAEQQKFMDLFAIVRDNDAKIDKNLATINALIKHMNFKYGDLNEDGKLDRTDLTAMLALVTRAIFQGQAKVYNKAADLDGDGKITMADYQLLAEAVNGGRKYFPVDPQAPKGDMDGNGVYDNNDIFLVTQIMMNPTKFTAAMVRLADINGDGKVDYNDLAELIKKIQEQNNPTTPGTAPIATGTIKLIGTASRELLKNAGPLTGEVQTPTPSQTPSQSSTNLNQAY